MGALAQQPLLISHIQGIVHESLFIQPAAWCSWNYLVPCDCQEMVIPHLPAYKAPAFPTTLNYSPLLCSHSGIFFAIFVLFTSNSVSFLAKVMLLSLDVFFPLWIQFLIPPDSHSLNPFCIPEKFLFAGGTENENFFFSLITFPLHTQFLPNLSDQRNPIIL